MKRTLMMLAGRLAIFLFLAASVGAEEAGRFMIEAHTVSVTDLADAGKPVLSEEAIFKLDSHLGSVWRMETNTFQRISVRDLVSQKAFHEQKQKQFLERLDAIRIPEIAFRNESFSNAIAFLEAQIRRLDPTMAEGPAPLLRWKYDTSIGSPPPVLLEAQNITALESLKLLADICGMKYRVEDGCIVLTPIRDDEALILRTYQVSPELRLRTHGTTISNILSEIGFEVKEYCSLTYSPALDMLIFSAPSTEHERLQALLGTADLIRQTPGRFRLVSRQYAGRHLLFLLDGRTGDTWLYRATLRKNGRREESFDLL